MGSVSNGFTYVDATGRQVKNDDQLNRIRDLVIPPAWKFVRISPAKSSSIQAIGMDLTGRIQYLYNAAFTAKKKREKFLRIENFGRFLPRLRDVTNEHMQLEGLTREKVLAVMMRLINSLYFRVGTEESVRRYRTFGITTLKNKHLTIRKGGKLIFEFVGKSHVVHRKVLVDEGLATIMRELKNVGKVSKLFNYLDDDGKAHPLKPVDVNSYLKSATAPDFSSKDLRTWGGSLLAARELARFGKAETELETRKNIVRAVKRVAGSLAIPRLYAENRIFILQYLDPMRMVRRSSIPPQPRNVGSNTLRVGSRQRNSHC